MFQNAYDLNANPYIGLVTFYTKSSIKFWIQNKKDGVVCERWNVIIMHLSIISWFFTQDLVVCYRESFWRAIGYPISQILGKTLHTHNLIFAI